MGRYLEAELVAAIAAGGFGFVLVDDDGRVLSASTVACELLGRDPGEPDGLSFAELVHPDDRRWSMPELELLFAGTISHVRQEVRLVRADGSEGWCELHGRRTAPAVDPSSRVVLLVEDTSDRLGRERELRRLADADPLTGVYNRRRFIRELERQLALGERYGATGALLMLDLDGLKRINDAHGPHAGDRAITAAAWMLQTKLRSTDVIARIGGDEFAVLLPHTSLAQAVGVAETLLEQGRAVRATDSLSALAMSIGIAVLPSGSAPATVLKRADAAMHEAKRAGGGNYAIYTGDRLPESPAGAPNGHDDAVEAPLGTTVRKANAPGGQPGAQADLGTVLQTVADLGEASLSLLAWDLCTDPHTVAKAWSQAVRGGLLEHVRYDQGEGEWICKLTKTGLERLRSFEPRGTATHDHYRTFSPRPEQQREPT
jgi:diguanylate cyclase (GGDEF)-like protein/PAS domain S-box-containing protein